MWRTSLSAHPRGSYRLGRQVEKVFSRMAGVDHKNLFIYGRSTTGESSGAGGKPEQNCRSIGVRRWRDSEHALLHCPF